MNAAPTTRVLVVDDDPALSYTLKEILESEGLEVVSARDGLEGEKAFLASPVPLVVTDLRMPGLDGIQLMRRLLAHPAPPKVIVITAHGSERQAVEAMKAGAYDYLRKPFDVDELLAVVRRAIHVVGLAAENEKLAGELALSRCMVFVSEPMQRLAVLIARVAPRDVTVLLTGESGTGKERVAEAIVRASSRADQPYVRFNCAALNAELAEAELFGHTKGAFTGAVRARPGLFREADHGTLLLDEVGELASSTQAKLLRVLQEGEVRAVGEERSRSIDVRVIAATHRDLPELVRDGRFREDLFYRLNVVPLRIAPLREHTADIAPLSRHFLGRYAERFGLDPFHVPEALFERLAAYHWPGNVRELQNAIESLVVLSPPGSLDLSLLPSASGPAQGTTGELTLKQRMDAHERGLIVEALRAANANRSVAAARLGISRVTLHEKLKKHGIARGEEPG